MNDVFRKPVPGLTAEAAELVETYFARVRGALLVAAVVECDEVVDDLRENVMEELAGGAGTPADVTRVLAKLGPPEALAAEYAGDTGDPGGARRPSDADSSRLHGTLLGMPYDVRVPSSGRIASRWWDPRDPRIFMPRVFGLGWDINFGALAVKLHLVRPDDEDEPFATVPDSVVASTMAVPIALAVALLIMAAVSWAGLPHYVPAHWNAELRADQFWDRTLLVAFLALMSLGPLGLAASVHLRRRPALSRVAASAAASLMATLALTQFVQAVRYVGGDQSMAPTFIGLALALIAPFVMLVVVSRIGRSAEQRRDLSDPAHRAGSKG
jgi:hypothetical protein